MNVGVMVTNGGPHPAAKHADATAWKISDLIRVSDEPIDPSLSEVDRIAIENNREAFRQARNELEAGVKGLIEKHHGDVQKHERQKLKEQGSKRLAGAFDHDACGSDLCDAVVALTKNSVLAAHFAKSEVHARVVAILDEAFASTAYIERSWHADRNPDDTHCRQFRQRHPAAPPTETKV